MKWTDMITFIALFIAIAFVCKSCTDAAVEIRRVEQVSTNLPAIDNVDTSRLFEQGYLDR